MMKGFGDFLQGLRGGMTLREAGKRSGLSHTYIRELELEKSRNSSTKPIVPTPETLKKLSNAYGYSYVDLMVKAGHLTDQHLNPNLQNKFGVDFDNMWYVRVMNSEVMFSVNNEMNNIHFSSLSDFSEFMEILEDREFKRIDTHLYVNLDCVKYYDTKTSKLYFNEDASGDNVEIAPIRRDKLHDRITRAVAKNTNKSMEITMDKGNGSTNFSLATT